MIIGNVFGEANSNLIPNNKLGDGYKNHWSDLQIQTFCKEKWGNEYETILEEFKKYIRITILQTYCLWIIKKEMASLI